MRGDKTRLVVRVVLGKLWQRGSLRELSERTVVGLKQTEKIEN